MDQVKQAGREIETETKKGLRELDGHDLGDDIANAGDEAGRAGDRSRQHLHSIPRWSPERSTWTRL